MGAPRILAPTTISGGIPTAGAGTLNTVALWTPDGFTLGNSLLTQAGSVITNATGAIRANGTTQTTPAFMRYDATNSGIYFPGVNEIGFTISGAHAMFISSGRLVGIGTTSPNALLALYNAATPTLSLWNSSNYSRLACVTNDFYIDAGLGGAAGAVVFRRGSSSAESARIDSSGNVGIGTASPGYKLDVSGVINTTDQVRVFSSATSADVRLNAGFGGTVAGLGTVGAHPFMLFTSNVERARIDSSGNLILNTANTGATIQAAGSQQGLKLPATPGNADTQTLDCYLDGGASGGATWAPVDNSGAGLTFTVTSARYMRIGRLVLASFDITFPATASGAQAKVSLPVTSQAVWQGASIGFGPNVPGLAAAVNNADVAFWTYGAATTNTALSGARLIVSMSYFAN